MGHNGRGQVSIEYLIVASLVLLFLVVMGVMLYQKYTEWADMRTYLAGRTAAITTAESIDQVATAGDGYWQTFTIRSRYVGDEFNVTFKPNNPTVFIEMQGMTMHVPLLTSNISCNIPACNTTPEGIVLHLNNTASLRVINNHNQIYIDQVQIAA